LISFDQVVFARLVLSLEKLLWYVLGDRCDKICGMENLI